MLEQAHPFDATPDERPRLLIVDDEPKNLRLLANIFVDDYQLSLATSGEQALQLLAITPDIELILLDLMMPELDGHQVYARLQQQPATRDIPVIFVTARHDADNEIIALGSGAADYLHKPVHVGLARARVKQQLTLARQRRELQAARAAADAGSRAKSRFLTSISHELRTPLNAILGFSQMLQLDQELNALQRASVTEIHEAGQHLLALIDDVLDLGKIEASRVDLSLETVDLQRVIESCVRLIEQQAHARGIRIELHPPTDPVLAWADHTRVRQVLVNLMSNALKYNRIGKRVTVRALALSPEWLRVEVEDDGQGIEPELRPLIFDAFQRGESSKRHQIEGTGIGLTICRRLVLLMGGQIDFESTLGQGTRFWFTLPSAKGAGTGRGTPPVTARKAATSAHLETRQPIDTLGLAIVGSEGDHGAAPTAATLNPTAFDGTPAPTPVNAEAHTILCVDDNPSNLRLLEIALKRLSNVRVVSCPHPKDALRLAAQHQPAVILLDIQMPELDGYEVLRRLQAVPAFKNTPIAALSANAMEEDIKAGLAAGFVDYFTKPFDVATLLRSVQALLPSR